MANFAAVVTAQFIVFFVCSRLVRASWRSIVASFVSGIVIGVPLGLAFDLFVGSAGRIFTYVLPLTPIFLIANGALSYGFAIATILLFRQVSVAREERGMALLGFLPIAVSAVLVFIFLRTRHQGVETAFLIGGIVLLLGEGITQLTGRSGPILLLLKGTWRPFVILWLASIALGAAYEAVNAFWPVWVWRVEMLIPEPWWTVLLVVLGYFILFHPMWVLGGFLWNFAEATKARDPETP